MQVQSAEIPPHRQDALHLSLVDKLLALPNKSAKPKTATTIKTKRLGDACLIAQHCANTPKGGCQRRRLESAKEPGLATSLNIVCNRLIKKKIQIFSLYERYITSFIRKYLSFFLAIWHLVKGPFSPPLSAACPCKPGSVVVHFLSEFLPLYQKMPGNQGAPSLHLYRIINSESNKKRKK